MERLMKILILSLLSLIVISCTHEEQVAPEDGEKEERVIIEPVLTEKEILDNLNQSLHETETLLGTAKLTQANLNASNEHTVGASMASAMNLISSAADQLKSAIERTDELSKREGVSLEGIKEAKAKVTTASVAAKEAVDLFKKEERNIQIMYKAQMEKTKPTSKTEEVKNAEAAVAEVSKAMQKSGKGAAEAVEAIKNALDESKIESITNTASKIREAAGLVIKIAEKTGKIVKEVLNPLNAT
ncbi:OspD family protein [Borrelia sp. RT5S]|uniref:OspD family protein n=1 Tax=Borrelia sp. RT5S TaxID=2898581 RepID=UPI001E3BBF11|nr:OspD family protein [Borrelia sp. RT5S]UGQ16500.1 OspD family protein [Borrelia sp. RT5S]